MRNQKYVKSCCHKTNLGNYFDDPTLPTGSLRYACVNTAALHCSKEAGLLYTRGGSALTLQLCIAARRLGCCTQEAVLSQRAAKCGLHNSVKLCQCSLELDLSSFRDILGE